MSHLELLSPIEWSIPPEFIINLDHPFNIVVFWLKRYILAVPDVIGVRSSGDARRQRGYLRSGRERGSCRGESCEERRQAATQQREEKRLVPSYPILSYTL